MKCVDFFYSHNGWDGTTKYGPTDRQWTLIAPPGKRVELQIRKFHVKILSISKYDIVFFFTSLSVATMTASRSAMSPAPTEHSLLMLT